MLHSAAGARKVRGEPRPAFLASLCRVLALVAPLLLCSCATRFDPEAAGGLTPLNDIGFLQRTLAQHDGELTVKVSALSGEESLAAFGVPLADDGIQPVWIEIENRSDQNYVFLPIDVDPDYFAPFEIAWKYRFSSTDEALQQIGLYFERYQMPFFIGPQETISGFVFTNLDKGAKAIAVDLIGEDHSRETVEFVVEVPGRWTCLFDLRINVNRHPDHQ